MESQPRDLIVSDPSRLSPLFAIRREPNIDARRFNSRVWFYVSPP